MTAARRIGATSIVAAALGALACVPPASAAEGPHVFSSAEDTTSTTLRADDLYPGGPALRTARVITPGRSGGFSGAPAVGVRNLADYERGCNGPEQRAGDVTCGDGPDQGELSEQLEISFTWATSARSGGACEIPGGTVTGLTLRELDGLESPAAGSREAVARASRVCISVSAWLPVEADNRTQSDLATFDVLLGLSDDDPPPAAQSAQPVASTADVTRAAPARTTPYSRGATALPRTGGELQLLLVVGVGLLTGGAGLAVVGRSRAARTPH